LRVISGSWNQEHLVPPLLEFLSRLSALLWLSQVVIRRGRISSISRQHQDGRASIEAHPAIGIVEQGKEMGNIAAIAGSQDGVDGLDPDDRIFRIQIRPGAAVRTAQVTALTRAATKCQQNQHDRQREATRIGSKNPDEHETPLSSQRAVWLRTSLRILKAGSSLSEVEPRKGR